MVKEPDYSQVQSPKWETYKLKDVFSFLQNNTLSRENLNDTGGHLQNIHYGDILVKYGNIVDCSMCAIPFINDNISAKIKSSLLQDGDVIMADTAEDETVGKTCEILGIGDCAVVSGLHTFPMRPKKGLFKKGFLGYYFNSKDYHNQIIPYITGIKVSSISRSSVKETLVLCPSPPEQQAIAEALSDIDRLIASTEKLIAKKKAIKQGLMQELLTGKRRLPGFTKPWERKDLGSCLSKIVGGGTPSRTIAEYWNGNIPWVTVKDFTTFTPNATQEYITPLGLANSASHLIPAQTILIATRMSVGRISVYNVDVAINQDLKALFPSKNICTEFLYWILSYLRPEFENLGTGSTVNGIRVEQLRDFEIKIPNEYAEQDAIAEILSDLDKVIEKQLQKLSKCQQIKQGMMSELLTGRIRLLNGKAAEENGSAPQVVSVSKQNHNEQFDDAVLISAIVNAFYSPEYYLGRKKVQKLLYLARRHQNASTDGFLKKAAGPYKPSARYSGGERIAVQSQYIIEKKSSKGSSFEPCVKMQTALNYAEQWGLTGLTEWLLQNFQYTPVNDLEVLATVDMAICDLKAAGIPVSLDTVKDVIRQNPEWKPKLAKPYFSDNNICTQMQQIKKLLRENAE